MRLGKVRGGLSCYVQRHTRNKKGAVHFSIVRVDARATYVSPASLHIVRAQPRRGGTVNDIVYIQRPSPTHWNKKEIQKARKAAHANYYVVLSQASFNYPVARDNAFSFPAPFSAAPRADDGEAIITAEGLETLSPPCCSRSERSIACSRVESRPLLVLATSLSYFPPCPPPLPSLPAMAEWGFVG